MDTSEAPIFEAVSTPKRVSNFNHVRQFMDYLHEFEAEKVEEKRRGFGSSGFDFDLGESKNRLYNPYYTKNKKTYEFVKNAVRLQYQQMVLVKKFDRDLSRVLGVCSSTFGDADLYVLGNEAGEFELEIGDWFRGILDRKKTAERLIVDKIEEKMEPAAKHRLTAKGEFVLQLEIDLRYRRRPSDFEEDGVTRKQFAIIEDNIVGKFFIDKLDWFLFGKRVHGEVIFVENSPPSSWKFHKMIEDIPDGVEFKKWLAQKSRDGDIRDQQFVPANIDGNDSDFEDDDDYDRPFVSRKAENRQNSSPNFNLNTNQNYERTSSRNSREDAGISMRSGGEHFEKPPSRSNHRFSPQNPPTSGEYVYNPQKQPGRSNHNISPQNPPTSGEYVHNSQKPTSRSNHNISPQNPPTSGEYVYNSQKARSQAGSRLDSEMTQDDLIELGIVTQQIDDREFIVFSDTRKCAVFYELIPNSTNARLGELFKFRSVRVMNPTGHYNFKVSEVIRVENLADIGNPVNIVENCAQMGVSVDLSKVDEDEARYGVFISQSNDLGRVIYGENISTPTSDCLDAKQFHDLYKNRESSRKMLCFCQFEFRRAINASHYEYQWVLKSCEGTVESYLERQRRLEMRNLGGGGQQTREYLDDDDIAQAKRRNAENLRSVQNSRNTTAVDEMYFKEPMPSSSYSAQPPPQPPQFRQNENYRFDEMPSRNESRSGEGRGGYSRNSRDDEYSRRPLQEPHQNYPEETRILTQNSSNGRGPGSTTSASGTNSADTETLRKLQRELRHLYKINDFFMKSASIRKAVKQEDGDIFDEWEDHMKRVRDLLSTTAQNKS
ncbi:unnamed protein product [Caenorhabditis angaria]|uniref:Uncharacterized protein n=1 Tax=Caenorhabditis angaria TaxID=860376 RepID=A0A9P1IN67_9PELO|nr:unnamed protein product [Caenorhabditis angaria]